MRATATLPRRFFQRPAEDVAPDLLGCILVAVSARGVRVSGRIVETEAYGPDDPASHAFRGPTRRNHAMFGPPGHLYVYFTYGMHYCANVVTGRAGEGSAVLLRAVEPLEGIAAMRRRRSRRDLRDLCRGPARLTQAFAIGDGDDGTDLVRGRIRIQRGPGGDAGAPAIASGPRIGISVGRAFPWRYWIAGDRFVSGG